MRPKREFKMTRCHFCAKSLGWPGRKDAQPASPRLTPVANHALHPSLMVKNESALVIATVARVVRLSTRHAWIIIPAFLVAAILAGGYVSRHIAINTDCEQALVEFASLAPARDQAQRSLSAADRPVDRRHRRRRLRKRPMRRRTHWSRLSSIGKTSYAPSPGPTAANSSPATESCSSASTTCNAI